MNLSKMLGILMVAALVGSGQVVCAGAPSRALNNNATACNMIGGSRTAISKSKEVHYWGTKVLRSSQLVQRLTGSTSGSSSIGTLAAVRLAIGLSAIGDALMPDGTKLSETDLMATWGSAPIPNVSLYLVRYASTKPNGRRVRLSGLVVIPDAAVAVPDPEGVLVFMHATTAQRDNAPGNRSIQTYEAIALFAHPSVVLAMPDYLGYGADKKGIHPYCLGSYNAPAGRSIILAARELMAKLNRTVGTNIYITGYSEGGANALWLTRYLEESNQPTLLPTRSAPMAGPYELSRATALSFISPQPPVADQENATFKPILITFAASATAALLRNPLATLIQEPLADQAAGLFPGPLADETLGVRLLATAVNDLAYVSLSNSTPVVNPKNLLDDAMVRVIEQHDTNDPGLALWAANDVVDWTPRAPVLLVGVLQDSLVPFAASSYPLPTPWATLPEPWETATALPPPYAHGNAQSVIAAMRQKGIGSNVVAWTAFNGLIRDEHDRYTVLITHSNGCIPSGIVAFNFFFSPTTPIPQLPDPAK